MGREGGGGSDGDGCVRDQRRAAAVKINNLSSKLHA